MAAPGHAVALLLALWAAAAAAQDTFTADTPVVKEQKVLDGAAFPARRPPLWPFRTLDTASVATCERKGPYGWKLTIKHKDLKGITEPMMVWLFANLASGTSTHPTDGQKYPNFLLYHPRDHILHTRTDDKDAFRKGRQNRFVEFPLTGCRRKAPDSFEFDCPKAPDANPGWLSTSNTTWTMLEQTNGTSSIKRNTKKAIRFSSRGCSNPPDGGPCAWVTKTTHTWKTNKATGDLTIASELRIGIGLQGPDQKIVDGWRNGVDAELRCNRVRLHFIEEIGGLEHWLPQAYAEAGGAGRRH